MISATTIRSSLALIVATLITLGAAHQALAQPSKSQIRRELTKPGVKKIIFTKSRGKKQWNWQTKTHEFVRGVNIVRVYKEIPGVDLLVVGDVVYQRISRRWRYWKFRVAENRYLGLPDPSKKEILALVNKDLRTFVSGYSYNKIVGNLRKVRLAKKPKWKWHTPTRVSFTMHATFDIITSNTEVETRKEDFRVSLYRDHYKSPWTTMQSSSIATKTLGRKKYTSQKIRAMTTLGAMDSARRSRAAAAKLPKVTIPAFKSASQLARFVHNMLRDGTPAKLEALLMKTLAPSFFNNKDAGQLNQRGAALINSATRIAYKLTGTYKLEYCKRANVDRRRTTKTRFFVLGVINRVNTVIGTKLLGGTYKDGVKVGQQWMITELSVGARQDKKALQYINSFSSRKKLCPKD